jgi:hypothetical protein
MSFFLSSFSRKQGFSCLGQGVAKYYFPQFNSKCAFVSCPEAAGASNWLAIAIKTD